MEKCYDLIVKFATSRLVIRHLSTLDADSYCHLSQNKGFQKYQISDYTKPSREDAARWISEIDQYHIRNGFGIVGVFLRNSESTLIGIPALKYLGEEKNSPVEIMYRLSDQYWGQGFGSEIALALRDWAFVDLKLSRLTATVDSNNTQSKRILHKLGFRFSSIVFIQGHEEELHELHSNLE